MSQTLITSRDPKGLDAIQKFEGAYNKVRLDEDSAQRLNESEGFWAYVANGIRKFSAPKPNYDTAHEILGNDFISPEEIADARNLAYSDEQLRQYHATLPSEEMMTWCREHDAMLIAGPSTPLSLLQIRDLRPEYFYSKSGGWYAERSQRFSREQKVESKWYAVRKGIVPNSTSRTWNEQQPLLSEVEYVPNDAELEWAITTYKAVRGVNLLPNVYARTASVDSDGVHVDVGSFGAKGLSVSRSWGDGRDSYLGVASARKF